MTFEEYGKQAITTDLYKGKPKNASEAAFVDKILGLTGESGEVAEKIKKILRDQKGQIKPADKKELIKELGDILWYINSLSVYLGTSLESVAKQNLAKVLDRKKRGVTGGQGDNR